MNAERLTQLKKYLEENPQDPFSIYALALEYQKTDLKQAQEYFETLLKDHSDYTPTYYQAAKLYQALEKFSRAKEIYLKGIEVCQKAGETKAVQELRNAYQELLWEEEE